VLVHVVDLVIGPIVHWYTVLLVGLSHVTSFCSLRRPISALISASSLSVPPPWAFTFTSKVEAPASTLFCSSSIICLRTSALGDLERLTLAPQSIHLRMAWRVASLSVRYRRLMLSSYPSRHSVRATNSGRFELTPSSSRPTLLECRVRCSWRRGGDSGVWACQTKLSPPLLKETMYVYRVS
jgi:hypothetical protein